MLLLLLCLFSASGSPANASALNKFLQALSTNLAKPADQQNALAAQNYQVMKNIMDLLYSDEKVTNVEFNSAVTQSTMQTVVKRLNAQLYALSNSPANSLRSTSRRQTFRVFATAIIASILNRERLTLTPENYSTFVLNVVKGSYTSERGSQYNELAADGEDVSIIPIDDIGVHMWHLNDALAGVSSFSGLPQVDTIAQSDDFRLCKNLIFIIDCVLQASTTDTGAGNVIRRYSEAGLWNQVASLRKLPFSELAGIQQYAQLMLGNYYFFKPETSRWNSFSVEFPLRDVPNNFVVAA